MQNLDINNHEQGISKKALLINRFLREFLYLKLFHYWTNLWLDCNYSLDTKKIEEAMPDLNLHEENHINALFNEMLAFQMNELYNTYPKSLLVSFIDQQRKLFFSVEYKKSLSKYSFKKGTTPSHFLFANSISDMLNNLKKEINKIFGSVPQNNIVMIDTIVLNPVFLAGLIKKSTHDISQWVLSINDEELNGIIKRLENTDKQAVNYQDACKKMDIFLENYGFGQYYFKKILVEQTTSWFNELKDIRKEFNPQKAADEMLKGMMEMNEKIIKEKGGLSHNQREAFEKLKKAAEEFKKEQKYKK